MLRYIPLALGLVLIISLGVAQGIKSDRWTDPGEGSRQFAERLDDVPMAFGDWQGTDTAGEDDERVLKVAGAVGHLSRVYRNIDTGDEVSVFLICGHSRKITAHTPDKCYPAAGFAKQSAQPAKIPVDVGELSAEFYTQNFRKEEADGVQLLRVFWSWATTPEWQAPDWPQGAFAGVRAIYKVYLVTPVTQRNEAAHESVSVDFARAFIPQINRVLFPPEDTPQAGS